jgi:hypothetical protein
VQWQFQKYTAGPQSNEMVADESTSEGLEGKFMFQNVVRDTLYAYATGNEGEASNLLVWCMADPTL